MGNRLLACFLLALIAPSLALPLSIRSSVQSGNNLTPSVSTGIVIAICMTYPLSCSHFANILVVVIFIIPLLWCAYRLGTRTRRTRQNTRPLFVIPPPIFSTTANQDGHSDIPSSGQIRRPHPAHHKVFRPTSRS